MPVRIHHIVIDAHDLPALADFWATALGWRVLSAREREVVVGPDVDAPVGVCFMPAGDTRKTVKNRVHLDLTTRADDRETEIERLVGLGARRVDVGQTGDESWDVLADPEGNEFCVVRPKTTLLDLPPSRRTVAQAVRAKSMWMGTSWMVARVGGRVRCRWPVGVVVSIWWPSAGVGSACQPGACLA